MRGRNLLSSCVSTVMGCALLVSASSAAWSQATTPVAPAVMKTLVPREHHEWGRFPAGAWKKVKLVTQKLDASGKVVSTSTTETTTTLSEVDDQSISLRIDTIVEVAGKRFAKQPILVKQGLGGEAEGRLVGLKSLGTERLTISGRTVESEVRSLTIDGGSTNWTSKVHYCSGVAPYVLRREITSRDLEADKANYETTVEVIALDMPFPVRGELESCAYVRTIHKSPSGKSVTMEVRCEEVPGGYVAHSSKQLDDEGRLISRSTLELVEFYIPTKQQSQPTTVVRPREQRWNYYYRWNR